jgi:GTP cyclohydrolase I
MHLHEVEDLAKHLGKGLPELDGLVCVPRGGISAGALISKYAPGQPRLYLPEEIRSPAAPGPHGFAVVDDVWATGTTINRVLGIAHCTAARMVVVLMMKADAIDLAITPNMTMPLHYGMKTKDWIDFPWEQQETKSIAVSGPEDAVRRLIEYAGDDPSRSGLLETPRRVLGALAELRAGREVEFSETAFEEQYDDLVYLRNIPFASLCEHHMLPFWGTVAVGYLPHGKVLGASKIARIIAQESSAFTIQETLTRKIADRISKAIETPDVGVVTEATHSCIITRGPRAHGSTLGTSTMLGQFRDTGLGAEFMRLVRP